MPRHDLIASVSFFVTAAALVLIGEVNMGAILLIAVFAIIGILQGVVKPSKRHDGSSRHAAKERPEQFMPSCRRVD